MGPRKKIPTEEGILAVCIGIGCRWFGIPLPGPPAIMGAAMAVAMATGYTATDYILTPKSSATPPTSHVIANKVEVPDRV